MTIKDYVEYYQYQYKVLGTIDRDQCSWLILQAAKKLLAEKIESLKPNIEKENMYQGRYCL